MERIPGSEVDTIISQYLEVTEALERMFKVMRPRIKYELWRCFGPDDKYHLVGSCSGQDKESSEQQIEGIARSAFIELREERNTEAPGESELTECPYHRVEGGCVLGELKSPYCIGHIDSPNELDDRFGISGWGLVDLIHENLGIILSAKTEAEIDRNTILVSKFKQDIEAKTAHIEMFPMLLSEVE